jgi:TetR/AcrR family transcriptional regulator, fatty acid metabolism regulator protein
MTQKKNTTNQVEQIIESPEKTELILDAAVKVFADKGYYGARVSDIAQEAGIAYGLVYHYFKNKEDLLISIFRHRWGQFDRAVRKVMEEKDDPRQMIHSIVTFLFHSYKNNPKMIEVMILDVAKSTRFFNGENIKQFTDIFVLISEIVLRGQEQGIFKKDLDAKLAAYCLYGSVERIMLRWILEDKKVITDQEARSATEMVTTIILSGLEQNGK